LGNPGARLAQSKTQLPEEALTLAHLQIHAELAVQKLGQSWTIPHLGRKTALYWTGAQGRFHCRQLFVG
jgi:hypothetical protein